MTDEKRLPVIDDITVRVLRKVAREQSIDDFSAFLERLLPRFAKVVHNCIDCKESGSDEFTLHKYDGNPGERFCRIWEAFVPEWGHCHLHPDNQETGR